MKSLDLAKAAGIALAILIIDLVMAVGVVYIWGRVFHPGSDAHFYETAGAAVARLSTRTVGTALLFAASLWSALRNPKRNAYIFAVAMVEFYFFYDGASVAFNDFLTPGMGVTLLIKLVGGLTGAFVARRIQHPLNPPQGA